MIKVYSSNSTSTIFSILIALSFLFNSIAFAGQKEVLSDQSYCANTDYKLAKNTWLEKGNIQALLLKNGGSIHSGTFAVSGRSLNITGNVQDDDGEQNLCITASEREGSITIAKIPCEKVAGDASGKFRTDVKEMLGSVSDMIFNNLIDSVRKKQNLIDFVDHVNVYSLEDHEAVTLFSNKDSVFVNQDLLASEDGKMALLHAIVEAFLLANPSIRPAMNPHVLLRGASLAVRTAASKVETVEKSALEKVSSSGGTIFEQLKENGYLRSEDGLVWRLNYQLRDIEVWLRENHPAEIGNILPILQGVLNTYIMIDDRRDIPVGTYIPGFIRNEVCNSIRQHLPEGSVLTKDEEDLIEANIVMAIARGERSVHILSLTSGLQDSLNDNPIASYRDNLSLTLHSKAVKRRDSYLGIPRVISMLRGSFSVQTVGNFTIESPRKNLLESILGHEVAVELEDKLRKTIKIKTYAYGDKDLDVPLKYYLDGSTVEIYVNKKVYASLNANSRKELAFAVCLTAALKSVLNPSDHTKAIAWYGGLIKRAEEVMGFTGDWRGLVSEAGMKTAQEEVVAAEPVAGVSIEAKVPEVQLPEKCSTTLPESVIETFRPMIERVWKILATAELDGSNRQALEKLRRNISDGTLHRYAKRYYVGVDTDLYRDNRNLKEDEVYVKKEVSVYHESGGLVSTDVMMYFKSMGTLHRNFSEEFLIQLLVRAFMNEDRVDVVFALPLVKWETEEMRSLAQALIDYKDKLAAPRRSASPAFGRSV